MEATRGTNLLLLLLLASTQLAFLIFFDLASFCFSTRFVLI